MVRKDSQYYFVDINLVTKVVVEWGVAKTANLTGDTDDENVHRVFLTKGQFNKLRRKLN